MSFNKNYSMSKKTALLTAIAAICFILFFFGGSDYDSPRSYKHVWDLGHILFFSILTYLILLNWPKYSETTFLRQSTSIILITICLGSLIELAQTASFRTSDLMDVVRDIIGCLIALAFYAPNRKTIPKTCLKIFQTISVIMVSMAFLPLIAASIDETAARNQFPVLSDFETRFESDRWTGDADFSTANKIHSHGKASLKVELNTSLYSGVGLKYFPENWQQYNELQLSIFNPTSEPIQLTCRIHDRQHTRGTHLYEDRFNKSFSISSGWNLIRIPLSQIVNAPLKRKMALNQIQGLGIFAVSLPKPRTIYIDYVRLVNY
jgi:VanZ family protein